MKPEYFIAKKISSNKDKSGQTFSAPVIKVAISGIAIGIIIMIISLAIGQGFKKEIREKLAGFNGHINIINYDYNLSLEANPISENEDLLKNLYEINGIKNIQKFATKPGLIKSNNEMQGVVLKGIGSDYDTTFISSMIVEGKIPDLTQSSPQNEILISKPLANLLKLKLDEAVYIYFFEQQIKIRKFTISGIYDSNLPELDKLYIIGDYRHIQRLNGWDSTQIAGYEIIIDNFDNMPNIGREVEDIIYSQISSDGSLLRSQTIVQSQPQIFGWLSLLDTNIAVIIILIIVVAGFNMISGLLILILERTNMIGVLRSLGMSNWPLRKIFLYLATKIAFTGLVIGNIVGVVLIFFQKQYKFIKLNPENYFLDAVPVLLSPMDLLFLNLGAIMAIFLMMIGPSYMASRISPIKAIKFD